MENNRRDFPYGNGVQKKSKMHVSVILTEDPRMLVSFTRSAPLLTHTGVGMDSPQTTCVSLRPILFDFGDTSTSPLHDLAEGKMMERHREGGRKSCNGLTSWMSTLELYKVRLHSYAYTRGSPPRRT